MLTIDIDYSAVVARFNSMPDKLRAKLFRKTQDFAEKLKSNVQQNLTNRILNIRTGNLVRSIFKEVTNTDNAVDGRVYSSGVPYAAIHEFGGVIHHPAGKRAFYYRVNKKGEILSRVKASSKRAMLGIQHEVGAYDIHMPQRAYMHPAFDAMKPEIKAGYEQAAKEATGV